VKNLKIQKQRNKKIIYDIYCDGTFLGFLPKKSLFFVVEKYQLECDEFSISVNEEDYRLLEEKIYKYLWKRFCDFLMLREHSQWEAEEYLKRINAPKLIIGKFIEVAKHKNYLNENRFADVFIRSKISKNKSKNEIKSLLIMRKVNSELIEQILNSQYTDEDEEVILEANFTKAKKKYNHIQDIGKRKEKIINFMVRKGFGYYKIIKLIDLSLK
jgi:regulatory protein